MTNLYWPIYLNIEREFQQLLNFIHTNDEQLDVYSSKIGELILRSAYEIESISKELYYKNEGAEKGNIHFDYVAIEYLDKIWKLESKVIIISAINSYQTNRIIRPFIKDFKKENDSFTFSWNNSYQSLKHNRVKNIKLGSLKTLFDITAALFMLNIYFKNEIFDLMNDSRGLDFPLNLGSSIFSIKFHDGGSGESFNKQKDFDQCIYTSKATENTMKVLKQACIKQRENMNSLILKNPKFSEFVSSTKIDLTKTKPDIYKILGKDEHSKIFRQSFNNSNLDFAIKQLRHEGVLNMNQL